MARSSPLPPPPPPEGIRTWPDREALLRDRAVVLGELVRLHIGPGRLGLLVLWAALAALGWSFVGTGLIAFEEGYDVISLIIGLVCLVAGAAALVPAVVLVAVGVVRDRRVRPLLDAWGALDRDPVRDLPLRAPGVSVVWMVLSFLLCAAGLFCCVVAPASAVPGEPYGLVALMTGLGLIAWVTGLIGLVKAFAHRRWVLRVLAGPPAPRAYGAAHR
ncbi:hypothetical protein [Streptomyces nitrosporeus]|uniref:hypothetical protein n=1 Tax=Streptomyces nitrosporeus TaxID=28894 RepID=UPI00399F0F26